jgi:hypothetical protein
MDNPTSGSGSTGQFALSFWSSHRQKTERLKIANNVSFAPEANTVGDEGIHRELPSAHKSQLIAYDP